ncbi:MAG TPA: hypothetical protein VKQ71_08220 [Acidimicrobiales bacterium]|nr:hypothetical protein [Acidimicrobiales bacterium]
MRRALLVTTRPAPTQTAPTNAVAPSITGTTQVGAILTGNAGSWNGAPTPSEAMIWQSAADAVGTGGYTTLTIGVNNANGTYTLQGGDNTRYITVFITSTNAAGTATARSAAVGPVTTPVSPPGPVAPPVIT